MVVVWYMLGSRVARLRFKSQRSSSAGGVGGSSSSQEEICAVFSLAAENDDEGNVSIIRCVAVGVVSGTLAKTALMSVCCCLAKLGKGSISRSPLPNSNAAFLQPSN